MPLFIHLAVSEGGGDFNPLDASGLGGALWTWIIFLVGLPFMWKVVIGPMTRAMASRDDLAARKIAEAEKASQDAEKARAEVEIKLGEARAESAKVLAEARDRAGVREREIVEAAQVDAKDLLENARKSIETERDKAIAEIRDTVVDLTIGAASRVLERRVDSEDDRRLVTGLVGEMKEFKG